jgi:hypothetical protein
MRRLGWVALATLTLAGCGGDFAENSTAPVILRMIDVAADSGADDQEEWSDVLLSDVVTNGSVFNDNARLSFDVLAKNPNFVDPNDRTMSDVMLERYQVQYLRSDGHNVEGVDVPFRITGGLSGAVGLNDTEPLEKVIIIVRHQAKSDPPLRNYRGAGGEKLVTVTAVITVHGRTVSGHAVSTEGRLQINFADFADPEK